jgi:hypothetical protein
VTQKHKKQRLSCILLYPALQNSSLQRIVCKESIEGDASEALLFFSISIGGLMAMRYQRARQAWI